MVFGKLFKGLAKTRQKLTAGLSGLFGRRRKLDEDFLEELEEALYTADVGPAGTEIVERLKESWKRREIHETSEVPAFLRACLLERLADCEGTLARAAAGPTVILIVGVNGSGKTTSIAKLARRLQNEGHSVLLGAGDTFRAAAVEQLTMWADRLGIDIIKQATGADPAAVAFDAVAAAQARGIDYVIVDTAGRLHTQKNLMDELAKVLRVLRKRIPEAPHETLQVLDATTGQNAIRQAQEFGRVADVSGLVLAKMDGTAKGGAVFGIRGAVDVPVKFVGVGEGIDDLEPFRAEAFVDAILDFEGDAATADPGTTS